ncbi:dynein light chain Tctex-type protein 2B [Paramormyrops kingsleyae]|uniref:Dynein light chain Tctex-type 2B n=1 Tax=Paramormyrops kingsleyae TaxID=1676925 RepID=A0A3B3QLL9_9TELE|nr:tctex1 domain-containing protein 2 [Paramormyrops kingsleyae]
MDERCAAENTYNIRPNYQHKFKVGLVKECMRQVLKEELSGQRYTGDSAPQLSTSVADCIRKRLEDMGFDRYKFVVQVAIGEQRGQGIKMGARCFWDADTDGYVQELYMNDSLFCVAAAFGCFYY